MPASHDPLTALKYHFSFPVTPVKASEGRETSGRDVISPMVGRLAEGLLKPLNWESLLEKALRHLALFVAKSAHYTLKR